jgi:acyl carrier protein
MADIEPLRDFIRKQFLFDERAELGDRDPLLPDVIDSLGVMEVVAFVEEHFDVEIGDDELVAENFASLEAIASLIERKPDAA